MRKSRQRNKAAAAAAASNGSESTAKPDVQQKTSTKAARLAGKDGAEIRRLRDAANERTREYKLRKKAAAAAAKESKSIKEMIR